MARRDREGWRCLVAEWGRSGVAAVEFARRRGLSPRTLVWWRWRLRRNEQRAPELLPVRLVEARAPVAAPPTAHTPAAPLEAGLPGGIRLRFTQEVDAGYVAELVAGLVTRLPC